MRYLIKLAVACVFSVMSNVVVALPILTPTSLNPGDTYQLVYVTYLRSYATSDNIADYNVIVQDDADVTFAGTIVEGVQWSAIGSTLDDDARDNAFVSGPVFNLFDGLVALDFNDMWDGDLGAQILNVNGQVEGFVWTGTQEAGYADEPAQLGSTVKLISQPILISQMGDSSAVDGDWIGSFGIQQDTYLPLYALSDFITVPGGAAVPAPATLPLMALGLAALGYSRRKRQLHS